MLKFQKYYHSLIDCNNGDGLYLDYKNRHIETEKKFYMKNLIVLTPLA